MHEQGCLRYTSGRGVSEEQVRLQPQFWLFYHEQVITQLQRVSRSWLSRQCRGVLDSVSTFLALGALRQTPMLASVCLY